MLKDLSQVAFGLSSIRCRTPLFQPSCAGGKTGFALSRVWNLRPTCGKLRAGMGYSASAAPISLRGAFFDVPLRLEL